MKGHGKYFFLLYIWNGMGKDWALKFGIKFSNLFVLHVIKLSHSAVKTVT